VQVQRAFIYRTRLRLRFPTTNPVWSATLYNLRLHFFVYEIEQVRFQKVFKPAGIQPTSVEVDKHPTFFPINNTLLNEHYNSRKQKMYRLTMIFSHQS
jgi:hypothetical protein